jgi:transcriptional regulator with XRE-family HTH domain
MHSDLSPAAGETIGQRLKRLRLERSLSQRELAAPGVSYAYISRIEAGTRQPSVKALRRLATKLNVSADYLETGLEIDPAADREIRLSDLELAVRLGEWDNVEEPLRAAIDEAVADGDRASALRARVALATLAAERRDHTKAITLL